MLFFKVYNLVKKALFVVKFQGLSVVLENVSGGNMEHLKGLVCLQNSHLASVRDVFYGNSNYMVVQTVSERNSSEL